MLQISRALRQGDSGPFVTQTKVEKITFMRQFEITYLCIKRGVVIHLFVLPAVELGLKKQKASRFMNNSPKSFSNGDNYLSLLRNTFIYLTCWHYLGNPFSLQ